MHLLNVTEDKYKGHRIGRPGKYHECGSVWAQVADAVFK
jgi:hypothetical protein